MLRPAHSAALFVLLLAVLFGGFPSRSSAETIELVVSEPAGIRRFQYPVATALPESIPQEAKLRLRGTSAQFRRVQLEGEAARWWVDFNMDLLPFEERRLVLEYGSDVEEAPPPPRGLQLVETADGFQIINAPYISWDINRTPQNWLRSVKVPDFEHVRREGARFVLHGNNGAEHALGSGQAETVSTRVLRSGPFTIAVLYDVEISDGPLAGTRSRISLSFPLAKSWVEIDWQLDDPQRAVAARAIEVAQNLDSASATTPAYVDFGASTLVYLMLGAGQACELRANDRADAPLWEVLKGTEGDLQPFVRGLPPDSLRPAEGWAHVMDRTRCMALAVESFGGRDVIHAAASGTVRLGREEQTANRKDESTRLRAWLHFVAFPPQETAATSPQSMQLPPRVSFPR